MIAQARGGFDSAVPARGSARGGVHLAWPAPPDRSLAPLARIVAPTPPAMSPSAFGSPPGGLTAVLPPLIRKVPMVPGQATRGRVKREHGAV